MKKLIYHSLPGVKSAEFLGHLREKAEEVYVTSSDISKDLQIAGNLAEEEQESLVIAFPDSIALADTDEAVNKILTSSFLQIQKFVQVRMKKRFGQILCLVNSGANGLLYEDGIDSAFLAAQGGLSGLLKTSSKEYSKRGIICNVLYIDWSSVPLQEVAFRVNSLLTENNNIRGQVFALDGGKWL
ncbi:MAG: hypothetical protein QNJ31_00910 [Candidatus Caenarcaniphilales bacterium]|nr:hypothetical protein [Candidatus Caenarcaniphilales bacterium]